ncbi:MAG: transporter substrate-binding domain-containing protein [Deltaproteobacteria bacterium]|nr:transporter substrate-binding domain-containing protein [Deltaproteobacteria bacterium]
MSIRKPFLIFLFFCCSVFASTILYASDKAGKDTSLGGESPKKETAFLTKSERQWIAEHKEIRLGVDPEFAPFEFVTDQGQHRGIAAEYVAYISKLLGITMTVVPDLNWTEVITKARARELDILACVAQTEQRKAFLLFSEPYIAFPSAIFTKTDAPEVHGLNDFSGRKVAVVVGYYTQDRLVEQYPAAIPYPVPSILEGLNAVLHGDADAYVGNQASAGYIAEKHSLVGLKIATFIDWGSDDLTFGVRKDWVELVPILNKALAAIPPKMRLAIRSKWVTMEQQQEQDLGLTDNEKAWIKEHPTIKIHNEKDWPPFNYFEHGNPQGLSIDYMNLLTDRLGIKVEYVTGPSWNDFLEMMKRKELDVMLNIVRTEDRQKYILYTDPYIRNPNIIVSSQKVPYETIKQLFDKTVAFPKGFFYEEVLTKSFPRIKRWPVEDTLASLKAVIIGKADAALGEEAVVQTIISKNMLRSLRISGEVNIGNPDLVNLRIGVRDDWPLLRSAIKKAMGDITNREMSQLRQKWLISSQDQATVIPSADEEINISRLMVYSGIIFLVLGLLTWVLIKTVKKEDVTTRFGSPGFRLLVLAGLSIFVIIVCFLGWFTIERSKKEILSSTGESLMVVLDTAHEGLNLWVSQRISLMRLLGFDPDLVAITQRLLDVSPTRDNLLSSRALQDARRFFKNKTEIFANIGFFIINPDHVSIGSMRDANIGTKNFISSQRPDLLKRAYQGEVLFVPPIKSDVRLGNPGKAEGNTNQDTKFFMGPIRDSEGRIIAVMTLRVNPFKDFSQVLQIYGMFKTGETYAFNHQGQLLSESRFIDQLRQSGLVEEGHQSALNINIRDPGINLVEGSSPIVEKSNQPLTHMALRAIELKSEMDKAGQFQGHSKIEVNTNTYRDYRGVPVFGAWMWSADLGLGLATEIDADEALHSYYTTRLTVFSLLGFNLLLSIGAILFVLLLGERSSKALLKARERLEERVEERTTELRENQEQLQVIEERSRLLLNSVDEGIFGVDTKGNVNFINASAASILGYQEEELVGKQVHQLIHHSHADGTPYPLEDCPMVKSYTEGTSHHLNDEVLWRKDGVHFPVEYSGTPIKKNGTLVGAVISFKDITKRVDAEEAIKESEERIRTILDSINTGIIVIDPEDRTIVDANPVAERMIGLPREEIIGNMCHMFICPRQINDCPIIDHAQTVNNVDRILLNADKREIPILKTVVKVILGGKPHFVESFVDLTERKQAEEALQRNLEELEEFNQLTIGREEKMIELKSEINQLMKQLGKKDKYEIVE